MSYFLIRLDVKTTASREEPNGGTVLVTGETAASSTWLYDASRTPGTYFFILK